VGFDPMRLNLGLALGDDAGQFLRGPPVEGARDRKGARLGVFCDTTGFGARCLEQLGGLLPGLHNCPCARLSA
jgi:hypothetical protein